mgnify:CR=1 FL=1|tara:strand:+ start:739 stop:1215 length:477 start_codon:yes stop_codon:yes gene_type:complete
MTKTEAQRLARNEYSKWYRSTENGKYSNTIAQWKFNGLIWETEEEIEGIYTLYLGSTHCENPKCGKEYKNSKDKHMDHEHLNGKFGKFRNVVCNSCNAKIKASNTSGINGIYWDKTNKNWQYRIEIKGQRHSKSSKDKDYLIEYKKDYENKYLYISEN